MRGGADGRCFRERSPANRAHAWVIVACLLADLTPIGFHHCCYFQMWMRIRRKRVCNLCFFGRFVGRVCLLSVHQEVILEARRKNFLLAGFWIFDFVEHRSFFQFLVEEVVDRSKVTNFFIISPIARPPALRHYATARKTLQLTVSTLWRWIDPSFSAIAILVIRKGFFGGLAILLLELFTLLFEFYLDHELLRCLDIERWGGSRTSLPKNAVGRCLSGGAFCW